MKFEDKYPTKKVHELTEVELDEISSYDLMNKMIKEDVDTVNSESLKFIRTKISLNGFIVTSLVCLIVLGLYSLIFIVPILIVHLFIYDKMKKSMNWSIRMFKTTITLFKDNKDVKTNTNEIFEYYFSKLKHVDVKSGYKLKF